MALTKTIEEDQIQVVGEFKKICIRTATVIKEDGKELSRTFHRKTINPGTLDASDNLVDRDISAESADVKGIAATVWTTDVKTAWKNHLVSIK
tara:strand:- start:74 stop:352 length:279 start_codon:yes stop_codon:yes gene_type:complete